MFKKAGFTEAFHASAALTHILYYSFAALEAHGGLHMVLAASLVLFGFLGFFLFAEEA